MVAGQEPRRQELPPGAPGIGSIFVLAFLVILLPGVVAYALLRLAGLPIGAAGLLGLLVVFVGLGLYPWVLQKLRWVPPRRARSSRPLGQSGQRRRSGTQAPAGGQQPEGRTDESR